MKTIREPQPPRGDDLVALLLQALRELALAGEPQRANLLAGRAWAATRHTRPRDADRINRAMHRLARLDPGGATNRSDHDDTHR